MWIPHSFCVLLSRLLLVKAIVAFGFTLPPCFFTKFTCFLGWTHIDNLRHVIRVISDHAYLNFRPGVTWLRPHSSPLQRMRFEAPDGRFLQPRQDGKIWEVSKKMGFSDGVPPKPLVQFITIFTINMLFLGVYSGIPRFQTPTQEHCQIVEVVWEFCEIWSSIKRMDFRPCEFCLQFCFYLVLGHGGASYPETFWRHPKEAAGR